MPTAENLPSGPSQPIWIIVPGTPGGGQVDPGYGIEVGNTPAHPIVLPPDIEDSGNPHPEHPIVLPPELVDPGWGIDIGDLYPDIGLPGDQPRPDHELPGEQPEIDNTLPEPEQPVDPDYGIDEGAHPDNTLPGVPPGPDQGLPPFPAHPIYIPTYPDNSLPEPAGEVGGLEFYQRKTVGINWDPALLAPAVTVGIYVVEGEAVTRVRTVPNTGASSVTYPQDWTGEATFRVSGPNGYCEGSVTVT